MLTPTSLRLAGRTAVVTGGASGIGAATARRLATEGAHVVVVDRDDVGAKKLAADVDGEALTVDVTDVSAVRAAFAQVREASGPIDVLVNNAGGAGPALFLDTDEPIWDAELAVNLKSVIACTHAVLPAMIDQRRGPAAARAPGPDDRGAPDAVRAVGNPGRVDLSSRVRGPIYATPRTDAGDDRYRWLNRLQAVAKGMFDGTTLLYDAYQLR